MCYDLSFTKKINEFIEYFSNLNFDDEIQINFAEAIHIVGHSFGNHPIIYVNRDDFKIHCKLMEWGVIPYYVKDEASFVRQRNSMLNARSERILDDPKSYWNKIKNRRCLIPVTGIYEHRAIEGWKKKVPYFIKSVKEKILFLPALYSVAELPDQETGELVKRYSYSLITRSANTLMRQIHNDGDNSFRMPLFLPIELSRKWLNEDLSTEDYKMILNYEIPNEELEYFPVYTIRTNKERPDGKLKNEPYEWEKLPDLVY